MSRSIKSRLLAGALLLMGIGAAVLVMIRRDEDPPGRLGIPVTESEREAGGSLPGLATGAERIDAMSFGDGKAALPSESADSDQEKKLRPRGVEISRKTATSAHVFGQWLDAKGQPRAHQKVRLFRLDASGESIAQIIAPTDESGSYSAHLPPGPCRVQFGSDSE